MPLAASVGLGRCGVNKMEPLAPRGISASVPALRCPRSSLALLLLHAEMGGERVPKQTSAEATNGELVST
jgi:hypothetical protein